MAEIVIAAGILTITPSGPNEFGAAGYDFRPVFSVGNTMRVSGTSLNDGDFTINYIDGFSGSILRVDESVVLESPVAGEVTLSQVVPVTVIPDATFTLKIADTLSFTGQVADVVEFSGHVATRVEKTLTTTTQINFTGGV